MKVSRGVQTDSVSERTPVLFYLHLVEPRGAFRNDGVHSGEFSLGCRLHSTPSEVISERSWVLLNKVDK